MENDDKIGTYVWAVNHLLKFNASSTFITKATLEISQLVKLANVSAIRFEDVVCLKVVNCDCAHIDKLIEEAFIK